MKLSDYVAAFLARQGIGHVFAITGGASIHLIHSIGRTPGITYICPQHEQAGAMAADAYARITGGLGAAVTTSGPGATNLITGVCGAYFDSVPTVFITGQVSSFRLKGTSGVRQMGFQETDVVSMFRPVTKYAVLLEDPRRVRYELEKACHLARAGRPGPVVVDIPDDFQRLEIEPDKLESFMPPAEPPPGAQLASAVDRIAALLERARRPVLILGWGVRLAGAAKEMRALVEKLGVPVAPTWAALDLFPSTHPQLVGPFGTHGTRYGNYAVQNADLIISVGARLGVRAVGSLDTFAREARLVMVDIDAAELGKFERGGRKPELTVQADARAFAAAMDARFKARPATDISDWVARIAAWKKKYPTCPESYRREREINPYVFVKTLARECAPGETIVTDTGCSVAWMSQAFEFKEGQRYIHDFNNTAMGYALPAAIGASLALGNKPVVCVTGDGSLQMNIQELATVLRHNLPIRIFLVDNRGYTMIQQTQDQWMNSQYDASTVESGLAFPDFAQVARAYGFRTLVIERNDEAEPKIREALRADGPVFCDVRIDRHHRVVPQVKWGRAIEDGEPLLDRREFLENMIIKPLGSSLKGEA